jgi:hypothetical protein
MTNLLLLSFRWVAICLSIFSVVSAASITASLDTCKGLNSTNFNATGSTKAVPLSPDGTLKTPEWTWYTGLQTTAEGVPHQYFWVDTTGSDNLNAGNLSYQTCVRVYYQLPDDLFNRPQNDSGNCQDMIGQSCLSAISRTFSASQQQDPICGRLSTFLTPPDECEGVLTPKYEGSVPSLSYRMLQILALSS